MGAMTNENGEPAGGIDQAGEQAPAGAEALDPGAQLAAVTAERDQLAADKAEIWDRLLRRQADFENLRKRVEREKAEIREYAGMEVARSLLEVLDNFERALKVECGDTEYAKGMELIYLRLFETLRKVGLDPIASEGTRFDPHLHHAVETVETTEAEDHTILTELQRGYNFRGRLLRPAMVRVAVTPSSGK
jgi:molecular chaperone GrpE